MDVLDLSRSVFRCMRLIEQQGLEVSVETLASYLAKDDQIRNMLDSADVAPEEAQNKGLLRSGDRAFRLLREAEEEISEWQTLSQELFTTLIPMVTIPDNREVKKSFEMLKKSIVEKVDVRELRRYVDSLKKALLAFDGSESAGIKRQKKSFWSLLGGKKSQDMEIVLETLHRVLMAVEELVPESRKQFWKRLVESVPSANGNLEKTLDEVVKFFTQLSSDLENERTQLRLFITELGKNLVEIEKHVVASLERRDRIRDINQAFHRNLDSEIGDLQQGMSISRSLEELRKIVLAKVALIKKAIEEKRRYEEVHERELDIRMKRLQKDLANIHREIHQIQSQKELLEREALTDPLTGVMNRRAYEKRIQEEWERYKRYGHIFSILVIDVDRFKDINDRYGHIAGDLILKELTRRVANHLRRSDMIFRYGGEEFVVILPGTDINGAKEVGEKIRKMVEATKFVYKGSPIAVSLSVGVSQVKEDDENSTDVFGRADAALYRAKSEGRNRVIACFERESTL
ncbi:GGDEF domain-containing protein [Thermodesulforhabdus norvegica]|uniref:diguanylate cyclase n=1 Tax=Thermodesulforhabdus norvegica TaxID=39841 RepID=A0A1I4UNE2_9BACT|nr:GGDEF domain-containing protein [Thermodesulforhabdus norvegica]SFM90486.1 diguanylate cyclase (GGDEF) domain-containing protein [Thermodesulforhabdus norvegica]